MTGFILGLILFTGYGYSNVVVPVVFHTEQACIDAGTARGLANANDNPPMIDGKPNQNLPLRMFKCVPVN